MTDNEVKWMIVGNLLRRNLMAGAGKEPVAYVYGGVRLPKLPENSASGEDYTWDKASLPYATIDWDGSSYMLTVTSKKPSIVDGKLSYSENYRYRYYTDLSGQWWSYVPVNEENAGVAEGVPIPFWTNFDLLNEDGSVYLKASEPIPVYE